MSKGTFILSVVVVVGLAFLGMPRPVEAQCQETADCNQCGGPCCGSSGCTWTPRCGAGGANTICSHGNCCVCASCCTLVGDELYCSCAKCPSNPVCPACSGSYAPLRDSLSTTVVQTAVDAAYDIGASTRALPGSGLEVLRIRVAQEQPGSAVTVAYTLRNGGNLPIVSYVILWRLSAETGAHPLEFSSFYDSTLTGNALPPGGLTDDSPFIGAAGARLRSVDAEVAFVEFSDGTRVGTAVDEVAAPIDTHRRRFKAALASYAQTLQEGGSEGLDARLQREATAIGASPCDSSGAFPSSVFQLLGRDGIVNLIRKQHRLD